MVTRKLSFKINKDEVLRRIDCYKESGLYEEISEEYDEILPEIEALCEPLFLMEKGVVDYEVATENLSEGTPVLMIIYSVGGGISKYSAEAFENGDYVKGMLADAMADSALFSLEKSFVPYLKDACRQYKMGIAGRLEAPHDLPMKYQEYIFRKTKAQEICGMGISSGFMLNPVKSNAILFVLSDDNTQFKIGHDCKNCKNYTCKKRHVSPVQVQVKDREQEFTIMVNDRESILDALMAYEASYTAVCGGKGKCGKCKIRVAEGELPVTSFDEECFEPEELASGIRLSCKAYPKMPVSVELNFKSETDFMIVTDYVKAETEEMSYEEEDRFGIAIDIGTTTIAVQLLNLNRGNKMQNHTTVNHQRNFGADVISRIKASVEGKKKELQDSIRKDLVEGIHYIIEKSGILPEKVTELAIAGNTTMIHLLMGYDCRSLGEYPFIPVNIQTIEDTCVNILQDRFLTARVRILPGISTFVGGDIVSGLYICDIDETEDYKLLIDLGTNGEIALGNKDRLMATSTAAGPAFEGGNIQWGVGSIEGAIAGIEIQDGQAKIKTIGDKEPTGICGTGVIETVAELVKAEIIDETGCLDEDYFDDGYPIAKTADGKEIVFTQQDVREVQLAKAAVRAGIETLVLRYGIEKEDISRVYLAGGFGYKLDCTKAIKIGMIPEEFEGKIEAVGNSSLGGAVKCILSEEGWKRVAAIGTMAEEINLSADKNFNEFYMEAMFFDHG